MQEKGYKAVMKNVKYEAAKDKLVLYNPSVGENNGKQQVVVCANPNVDAAQVKCTIDGVEVTARWHNINGDGLLLLGYDASKFVSGEHEITLSGEGYATYTDIFIVK